MTYFGTAMAGLENPRRERACELRASGKSQVEAYNLAFEVSDGSNASRFFKQSDVKARVREIVRRRSTLADLDEAWVLMQLKAIAGNGVALGDCIDKFMRGENGDPRVLQSTMVKFRAIASVVQANELIGKFLGMWKDKAGLTNPTGDGPPLIEVVWKGSPEETPPERA
jgi:hypothetical protein